MKFENVIGQEKAKDRLKFHFDAFKAGEPSPNFLFVAPRGMGKTTIAEAAGHKLTELSKGVKRFGSLNATSLKNMKLFWDMVLQHVNDRDVTLLIDECHKLKDDVVNALLTMINPNEHNRNTYTHDNMTVDIDMKRQNFFFATTEPQKLSLPFTSRTRRIDLEPYTPNELARIMRRNTPDIDFEKGVLEEISPCVRGIARQAVMVAKDIKTYLAPMHKTKFSSADWDALRRRLDILPLGLTRLELQVLRILNVNKDSSLKKLAATIGMDPSAVQRDLELYLLSNNLMEVSTGGRNITGIGQQYLKECEKWMAERVAKKVASA